MHSSLSTMPKVRVLRATRLKLHHAFSEVVDSLKRLPTIRPRDLSQWWLKKFQ